MENGKRSGIGVLSYRVISCQGDMNPLRLGVRSRESEFPPTEMRSWELGCFCWVFFRPTESFVFGF